MNKESHDQRVVVVTGASTGIGRATALLLDKLGFRVFAGVRKSVDGDALGELSSERLEPLLLDVTDEEMVTAAVARVKAASSRGLYGLVNNAGLSLNGPLELVDVPAMQQLLDVNVLGVLTVTKAFLPLLRRGRGRIVNVSSGHGLLAIPDKSVYAASKFAVQAISDSLRVELLPFGVQVSTVVVGKVETEVLGKIEASRQELLASAPPEKVNLYRPLLEYFDAEVKNLPSIPAEQAAAVLTRALTDTKPKRRYLVGPGARKMSVLSHLPAGLRDLMLAKAIYGRSRSVRNSAGELR
jgi:NAD(P)-dependent dehydrogenase (short-subunit alcohol dehydrogenase family)